MSDAGASPATDGFPAEPEVVHRHAVRILCLDARGRVLLMSWRDPVSGEVVWEPPGGGVEEGESDLDAARREWFEETGLPGVLDPDLGEGGGAGAKPGAYQVVVVPRRDLWAGRVVLADEPMFLTAWPAEGPEISRAHLMPDEQVNLVQARWLGRSEVEALSERVTPDVVAVLCELGAGGDWTV